MKKNILFIICLFAGFQSFGQFPTNGLDKKTAIEKLEVLDLTVMIGYKFNDLFVNQAFGRAAVSYQSHDVFRIGVMFDLTEGLFNHDDRAKKQEGGNFQKGLYNIGVSDFMTVQLSSGFDVLDFDILIEDFFLNPELMKYGLGISINIDEQVSIGFAGFRMPYQESFQSRMSISVLF